MKSDVIHNPQSIHPGSYANFTVYGSLRLSLSCLPRAFLLKFLLISAGFVTPGFEICYLSLSMAYGIWLFCWKQQHSASLKQMYTDCTPCWTGNKDDDSCTGLPPFSVLPDRSPLQFSGNQTAILPIFSV
uniref:Uncharacterized protein n=1 Tax=Opuntia streptacantha TaxID=393608 RepID=A0A7C9EMQ2_OPUST